MSDIIEKVWNKSAAWDGWVYTNNSQVPTFSPPTSLVATNSGTTNALTWTNGNASAETIIERGPDGTTWPELILKDPGVTSHDDLGLSPGAYHYRARHKLNGLYSAYTASTSATVSALENSRVLTGSGFGSEPTVVLFDRATGTDGAAYSLTRDVGTYDHFANGAGEDDDVRYITHAGRTWMAGRQISTVGTNVDSLGSPWFLTGTKYTEYYLEYRVVIPTGYCFPGASPNTNSKTWTFTGTASRWKLAWAWNSDYPGTTTTDCVFGNLGNDLALQGNAMVPMYFNGSTNRKVYYSYSGISAVNENLMGGYLKLGSSDSTFDGVIETIQANGTSVTRNVRSAARPWYGETSALPALGHDTFVFNSWSAKDQTNVQHGWADMYLAVGANARARVYTHNASTIAASTQIYNVTACKSAWSNTSITVANLASRESLPYMSVIAADGTLHENVSWS